jgi:hypothetical protein
MARVRDVDIDETPEEMRPIHQRLAGESGPVLDHVAVFARRAPTRE